MLCSNFEIKNKIIKEKKFKKNGKYIIPYIVVGVKGANEYIIKFPNDYNNLKKDIEYIADYHLIIECDKSVWLKILIKNIKYFRIFINLFLYK